CGGNYGGGGGYTPPTNGGGDTPPPVAARCTYFDISPNSVPHGGGNVTITWQTTNATSVSIDNGVGSVGGSGSKTVFVDSNKTFRLTAVGTGGNDTHCVDSVVVDAPPPKPAAKCESFTANRTTVPHGGGNVTLTWDTTNATSVSID